MGRIIGYFRKHKLQKWLLTASVGLTAGVLGALLVYPHVDDYLLIRDLASRSASVREHAINRAEMAARLTPRTLRKLLAALDTEDDVQFSALATALNRAGKLATPRRDPGVFDRLRAIQFDSTGDGEVRRQLVSEAIRSDRDNAHNRRLLAAAAVDKSAEVRERSALLAAKLGDDDALARLLADPDPPVSAAAALDAGLADRRALARPVRKLLAEAKDVEVVSSAAHTLMRLAPGDGSGAVVDRLKSAGDGSLRERLWHVLAQAPDAPARKAVREALGSARDGGKIPPPMLLLTAGQMGLSEAARDVRATLSAVGKDPPPLESQLLAALDAARRLRVGVRAEVYRSCRDAWGPQWPFLSMAAARELGRQADLPQGGADAPSREECIELLRNRASFSEAIESPKPGVPRRIVTTPVPSAAAAVALWELSAPAAADSLRAAAGMPGSAPGEYIAWHVARIRPDHAFALGEAMLPPLGSPRELRVYSDTERMCGAGLLALSARTAEQRQAAAERIRQRLVGGNLGGEDSFPVASAYRCALLILGRRDVLEVVVSYLGVGDMTRRQVVTALSAAGRREGLDWLLANPHVGPDLLVLLVLNKGLGPVLADVAPALPRIDLCGTESLRRWQARILRDYYAIHRSRMRPERTPLSGRVGLRR